MEPLLVITNSGAGTAAEENLERGLSVLRAGASVEVAETDGPGELDGVLHRAGSRRIVVAGGDGSLHAVVAALYRRHDLGRTLGLLPLGTGNDFARDAGIPLDVEAAARVVLEGHDRETDLIVDELGEVVVNNVHVGAGAQASRRADRWKRRLGTVGVGKVNLGKAGYPIGAALAAFKPPFLRLHVEVDGVTVNDLDQPVLMVAVGNGASVGGGHEITPHADAADGAMDVLISRAIGPVARFGYAADLALGRHSEREDVLYRRGTRVTISGEEFYLSADGEVDGPERSRSWRLETAAYRLLVPRHADAPAGS